jgi:Putative zinc-finger
MKCEVCRELLEEYFDAELAPEDQAQVESHLITCAECAASMAALTAEHEIFARYDRELEVPPFMWTRVAAHTVAESKQSKSLWRSILAEMFAHPGAVMAGAIVLVAFVVLLGLNFGAESLYEAAKGPAQPKREVAPNNDRTPPDVAIKNTSEPSSPEEKPAVVAHKAKPKPRIKPVTTIDQSDVLSSDLGHLDFEERDTAKHIEQSQNLLRSIRNVPTPDSDEEIDVTYDKALSRRLLNENVVLRREAEMKAKFPTKTLLTDLEPFLIDIANLPDHARPEEVRAIKERVQKTEIVAALLDFQDRGTNNR